MRVIRKNNSILYNNFSYNGFKFSSKKYITNLQIYNYDMIKRILFKRITKDFVRADTAIRMMLISDITEISDCNIMINELNRITYNLSFKYINYFDEFEYFKLLKRIYFIYQSIAAKKVLLDN